MADQFEVIVVGAGLMGSAAARHLAEMGVDVALVGPGEPTDKSSHDGVFASHYDQARITRKLDADAGWAKIAAAAIERYRALEQRSGIRFFEEAGSLIAGPQSGAAAEFLHDVRAVGTAQAVGFESLAGEALSGRFPFFAFPDGIEALFEASQAGWLNPRAHIRAQIALAEAQGAKHHRAEVARVEEQAGHAAVHCADGTVLRADRVVIACGGFSKSQALLPQPIPLTVYARTISFFEIDAEEAARLAAMPSLIYDAPAPGLHIYVLPPVAYPDGTIRIKLGGDPVDVELHGTAEIKEWFRSGGSPEVSAQLAEALQTLMPDLRYRAISHDSCVTAFTPTGKPLIYPQTDRIVALTGGNGVGAKCADELGRLGAMVATGQGIPTNLYGADFRP
ncbi:FAD-dependent oxidoreductase [Pseudooceanicola lipolyticus]|uniref:FAD-dependent oxidoreductase n=1 Tax=Pseudooceanicola lipolyticus TaxID=2029104 RepID=A0A2M8IYZ5_9RHOB|nr:FAD-dependent oxidoreductase [Pseudooceanicola lipolyticus]PJE35766.1 FAD-dependent oxidoreductase [Pseudooceanicola lipolyticus]